MMETLQSKSNLVDQDCPRGFAAWRRPWSSRISGSHKSRQNRSLSGRPVPIVLSRRDEAIDVSHARIRAAQRNLPFYVTHVTHGCHVFTTRTTKKMETGKHHSHCCGLFDKIFANNGWFLCDKNVMVLYVGLQTDV
ncbi:hypothetical protein DdX_03263 [Ditylenchus destructor]|uniref:Uncharacterized protein n=1 Tax=Ditylenchus destructor TaxID=166010 RepID=A0AAD4R6R3_9BILA|nr:hypothetical protein DdX_03263 [Ditylenchus destructor]